MLSEQHRSKLDGIVSQMTANGESEENIKFVVGDFKTKYDTPESAPSDKPFKAGSFLDALVNPQEAPAPEPIDFEGMYEGSKKIVKATPDILGNIKDTLTTKQGLSDLWSVAKGAGVPSLMNVLDNSNEIFWGGMQKGFKAVGLDTLSEFAGQDKERSKANAKKSSEEIKKFFYGEGDVLGYSDPNDTRSFLDKISSEDGEKEVAKVLGAQVPTFLALLGVTVVAKGTNIPAIPATLSASFAMNTGDAYQQGKDYVESTGQQMTPEVEAKLQKASLLVGATTAPLDAYGMDRILSPSKFIDFKSKLISKAINGVLDTGVDMVAEGGTEAVQEIIQNAWAQTYNENQDLFEGAGEAFFGGAVFGGGSSGLLNSSGFLRQGALELMKNGKTPDEIKVEIKKGAESAGTDLADDKIDEAIADAETVYNKVTDDIVSKLDSGKSINEVALEVSQTAPVPIDQVVEFVQRVDENREAPQADKAITELNALADKVDEKVLTKTARDLQDDFERVQAHIDDQVKDLTAKVSDLKERVDKAEDRTAEKKKLKAQLENARQELRDAQGSFIGKVETNAKAFRTFVEDYATKLGAENPKEVADNVVNTITDEANIESDQTIESLIQSQIGEIKPVSTKNRRKSSTLPKKEVEIKTGNETLERMNKSPKDYIDYYNETHAEPSVRGLELFIASNPTNFSKKELMAEFRKKPTQKDKVKEVVEKKGKASIKEIADETGILEPNVRRILGEGAKGGEFERIEAGVYRITTADGKEVAVIIPADAVETLPKLASEGFKADMVFLDIPYDTPAVKGGNRGVKYNLLSVEDFGKVLDATKTILRDENAPVIHMFSQAESGLKAMQKYNDLFTDKGFIPVGRGEYQKTFADGSPVTSPNGKVAKPEGIIVFNQSGTFDKELDLQFKMVRPKGYQTEKPAEMLAKMIDMTTEEGDIILDPFAGSGVTGAEAVKKGRKAVLVEKDKEVAEKVTKKRVEEAVSSSKTIENATEILREAWGKDTTVLARGKEWFVAKEGGVSGVKSFRLEDATLHNKGETATYTLGKEALQVTTEPTSEVIDGFVSVEEISKKEPKSETKSETKEEDPIKRNTAIIVKLQKGEATLEEYRAGFKDFMDNKEAIREALNKQSKAELQKRAGRFSYLRASDSKNTFVSSVLNGMVERFALSKSVQYSPMDKNGFENAIAKIVENTTDADLKAFADKVAENTKAYMERAEAYKKALTNPETLEEFQTYLEANKGDTSKLTADQLKNYDEQLALAGKAKREKAIEERGNIRGVEAGTELTVTESKNTKTGEDIFVVKLSDRVEKETYQALNNSAKKLGGYYSRFSKGFLFKDRTNADQFVEVGNGKEVKTDAPVINAENRKNATAKKLVEMATSMREKANEELSRERLTNTSRRAGMASSAEESARVDLAMADTMENLARAIESREAVLLDGITARTQIEELDSILRRAHYENSRKIEGYDKQEAFRAQPPTEEDIPFVEKFPHPINLRALQEVVQKGLKTSGSILLAKKVQKAIGKLPADEVMFPASYKGMEVISELADSLDLDSYNPIKHSVATFKRLKSMGVTGTAELRAILREYLTYRGVKQEADKVKELERKIIGTKVGIDFFPTPTPIAERMVENAEVTSGMKVLEPSAGNGNIAEVMKDKGANVDVIEISSQLRDVLEAKGFNVVANDFMSYNEGDYDAIVMNPPFSNNQDIEHIQHAYGLLKDGGKLSAIAGEGAFLEGRKVTVDFQKWLEDVGAEVEKLDQNTFKDKTLLATTGANARLITITKKKESNQTAKARELANDEVLFYLEASEAGRRVFVPERDSMDLKVVGIASTFPQFVPENMRSRKTFDRLIPFWKEQERPSNKTPMLQALYDIFTQEVEKRTVEIEKDMKDMSLKVSDSDIPFKITEKRGEEIKQRLSESYKIKKYKVDVEYGIKQAKQYLEDMKKRLGIDFDVEWVDAIVFDYSIDPIRKTKLPTKFAEGLMEDNTIAIKKEMDAYTAEHESIHLTLANLDKIEAFRSKGITRDKLMRAMADKAGIVWNEKTDLTIEEQIAYDFEKYVHDKNYPKPKGIIKQFFDALIALIDKFVGAYVATKGDIIKDYYDVLSEGYSISNELTRLENNGVVRSFIEQGQLDAYALGKEATKETRFKISEERDARMQKLKKLSNDVSDKVEKLEKQTEEQRLSLSETLIKKAETARIVEEAPEDVKKLSRFTNRRKKPVGELTERGLQEVETLEFENPEVAQKEVSDYLNRKLTLLETRKQLQTIRRQIQTAKAETKEGKATLRDVERRLKLRRRLLEQKDFYVGIGMNRGAKEQMNMIRKRGKLLSNTQEMIGISDERAKKIIGGRRIHTMSEKEFNDFMQEFVGKAQEIRATLDARDEVKSIIQVEQLNKVDNLIKALGLPTIDKMTQEQATAFASVLYQYQFGDTFLTKRELETTIRTRYGEIRTERELLKKIEEITGIPRNELRAIEGKGSDIYKNWFQLSKLNPFYNWLVGQKMLAKTKELSQVYNFRLTLDSLVKKARASRKSGSITESIWDTLAPTDKEVFQALDTGDFSQLTAEEKALADFLTIMFRTKYEKLVENFKDFKGRENYVTHMARTFMETLRDTGSLKEAYTSYMNDQKEQENAIEILASQTGEILAFDKFLPYMLRRSGQLVPSKNVSRIALTYFTATTRKELLDEFIPEAMLTLHGYKMLTGQTEKGLDLKPALEQFTKQYLNDAKGRKIEFITRQGSTSDTILAGFTGWISAKYIGGNPVLAFFNLFGDLLALSAGTTNVQKLQSLIRLFQSNNASEAIRGIVGHSPLTEIMGTQEGLVEKILPFWFSLMSSTSYLANQLTVRGMLTQEEFKTGIIEDKRIQEIAQQINKFKLTDSYGRSLVGNTTAGKASTQFKTWAVPFLITTVEHFYDLVKNFGKSVGASYKEKKLVNNFVPENKQQAIELARIVITGAVMYATVQALKGAFEGDDDKDSYLWRQINNNLNTIYGILAMPFDKTNLVPVVIGEINKIQDLLKQLWTMEEYKRPTKNNFTGDLKALETFKDIITPVGATRIFNLKEEEGTPRERLIKESLNTGEFDAEAIAIKTSEDWASKSPESRETMINNITQAHTAMVKYPDSVVVSIALGENNNKEKVASLVQYAKKVGVDQAYEEVKEIMKDRELYANQKKKTGALISAQLFRDFQVEVKKLKANQ